MIKKILFALLLILIAALLQSTLFFRLSIYHAVPDIALLILVFVSYVNGSLMGQTTGFFGGLLLDFVSFAPLGLNIFVRTVTGYLVGLLRGVFFLDRVFLPAALCAGATFLKAGILFVLNLLFAGAIPVYNFQAPSFWIELAMNTVLAPFLFWLFNLFGKLLVMEKVT
ncbi:MAG: rod shape-determining protein MreD [Spirochaetaceae bacterium]|nr:rod shape-determining protein MreD [Spirochaetaceae bacterium]